MALRNTHKLAAGQAADQSTPINTADPDTWPAILSLEEVAVIYRRTPLAIRHACKPSRHRDVPAPFRRHPLQWRKADVIRHLRAA